MRNLFSEDRGVEPPRSADMTSTGPGGAPAGMGQGVGGRYPLEGRHVCPFCGAVNETMEGPCPNCTMTNTAETRKATKSRIGPWYVLQSRNPAAPGMRYETLLGFVRKGRIKARSIVRGPTTHQLWRFACQVKGLSREFSLCYSCGGSIERDAQLCPQCNRLQDPPADPDVFLEGQGAPPAAAPDGVGQASAAARAVTSVDAWQDARQTPIFKELKLPPLADFPSLAPDSEPAVSASAPRVEPSPAPRDPGIIADAVALTPMPAAPTTAPIPQPSIPSSGSASPAMTPDPPRADPLRVGPPAAAPNTAPPRGADAPRKRNANDVFLSAKDLAAAFQLGFDGDANRGAPAPAGASHEDAPWARSGARDRAAYVPYRRTRRKRRVGRVIVLLLVLALGGVAAYLAVDVAARQRVFGWAEAKYMELTGANLHPDLTRSRRTASGPATVPAASADPDDPFLDGAAEVPPRPVVKPDVSTKATPTPTPADAPARAAIGATRDVTPPSRATTGPSAGPTTGTASGLITPERGPSAATRPAPNRNPTETARMPQAPPPSETKVEPRPAAATQPAPAPAPATARLSIEEARKRSRELWDDALKAEEAGDYGKAKALYEQMMKLPREVWYQGIEGRLRFAKEMLGEK